MVRKVRVVVMPTVGVKVLAEKGDVDGSDNGRSNRSFVHGGNGIVKRV